MVQKAELERLIGIVEAKLAALPSLPPIGGSSDYLQRHEQLGAYNRAADQALAELASAEGGKVRDKGCDTSLRLGGFTASCTHGAAGAMHNWLTGAKRRLAKLEAAE